MVQRALVDGGRLGRKVGRGFYEGTPAVAAPLVAPNEPAAEVVLMGRGPLVECLGNWLHHRRITHVHAESSHWSGLRVGGVEVHLSTGRLAAQLAHERSRTELAVMDWPIAPERADGLALAFAPRVSDAGRAQVETLWRILGWEPLSLRDAPGLVVARTLAMLVNEGADAVLQGVCDEAAADTAMRLGVNYPAGPFEWLAAIGVSEVVEMLDALFDATRSERYRVSPLLRQRLWS